MLIKALTKYLTVGSQLAPEDLAKLAKAGFKTIISNRPDGEEEHQPAWTILAETARQLGMQARHIPVVGGNIGNTDIAAFREALLAMPRPAVAFCRTGTRSTILWALANAGSLSVDERIKIAAEAGYDLEPIRNRLEGPSSGLNKESAHAQA